MSTNKLRLLVGGGLAVLAFAIPTVASAAPNANAIKTCEEAYKNGWTLTQEQVAQCQAAGAKSYQEPVQVANPGGQLPPGQQP